MGPQLAGQQLGVGHQGRRSSAAPTQVLEVVDRLNETDNFYNRKCNSCSAGQQ